MSGDALKKVKAGDPLRIPAEAYNRFVDAARAYHDSSIRFGKGRTSAGLNANVVQAYNASGQDVPWYAPVSITGTTERGHLQFGKPDDDYPLYGIAIEPIPADRFGLIAVAGGVYNLRVNGSVSYGDHLRPTQGQWYAEVDNTGPLRALSSPDTDGRCQVVFTSEPSEKVKVSSNDTAADYLLAKLAAGTNIELTELDDGNDEDAQVAHAQPTDPDSPANSVGTTAETEAAQTDSWTVEDGTLGLTALTRMAYNHAGDETLYGYYRTFKFDAQGHLTSVSTETRVTIDVPEACS